MERTKNTEEKKINWRKDGGGSFRMANGKIIKPGQIFAAYPSEIPEGFRDVVVALEEVVTEQDKPLAVEKTEYFLKSRGQGGWFDVVDANDKVMNEKALKQEVAEKYIDELMA